MSERSSTGFLDTVMDATIGRLRAAWREQLEICKRDIGFNYLP